MKTIAELKVESPSSKKGLLTPKKFVWEGMVGSIKDDKKLPDSIVDFIFDAGIQNKPIRMTIEVRK